MTRPISAWNLRWLSIFLALALTGSAARAGHIPLSPAAHPTTVDPRSSPEIPMPPQGAESTNEPRPTVVSSADYQLDGPADSDLDEDVQLRQSALAAVPLVVGLPVLLIGGMVCGLIGVLLTILHLPIPGRVTKPHNPRNKE